MTDFPFPLCEGCRKLPRYQESGCDPIRPVSDWASVWETHVSEHDGPGEYTDTTRSIKGCPACHTWYELTCVLQLLQTTGSCNYWVRRMTPTEARARLKALGKEDEARQSDGPYARLGPCLPEWRIGDPVQVEYAGEVVTHYCVETNRRDSLAALHGEEERRRPVWNALADLCFQGLLMDRIEFAIPYLVQGLSIDDRPLGRMLARALSAAAEQGVDLSTVIPSLTTALSGRDSDLVARSLTFHAIRRNQWALFQQVVEHEDRGVPEGVWLAAEALADRGWTPGAEALPHLVKALARETHLPPDTRLVSTLCEWVEDREHARIFLDAVTKCGVSKRNRGLQRVMQACAPGHEPS